MYAGKGFTSLFKGKTIDKLEDCFHAFTEDEKLEGNEAFWCSVCEARTAATKVLHIHRFPKALVLHIKRFKVRHLQSASVQCYVLCCARLVPVQVHSCMPHACAALRQLYTMTCC